MSIVKKIKDVAAAAVQKIAGSERPSQERITPAEAKASVRNRAAAYDNSILRRVTASIGFWLLFVLDLLYLIFMAIGGYEVSYLVFCGLTTAIELLCAISLLPVPVLLIGVRKRYTLYEIAFALPSVLQLIWSIYMTGYNVAAGVFFLVFAARTLLWLAAFFFSRLGYGGLPFLFLPVCMLLIAVCGSAALFEFPLSSRPMRYEYVAANDTHAAGYAVTDILSGMRKQAKIPATYKGEPVVAVDTGDTYIYGVQDLTLPESVTYVNMLSDTERLTVTAAGAHMQNMRSEQLREITFTSTAALPRSMPEIFSYGYVPEIHIAPDLVDEALHNGEWSEFAEYMCPVVSETQGYILYYTDFTQPNSSIARRAFEQPARITEAGETVALPVPDLSEQKYIFMGWYDSRDYDRAVTEVRAGERVKLYAKYYRLEETYLFDSYMGKVVDIFTYHYESRVTLPTEAPFDYDTEKYAFVGWCDMHSEKDPQQYDLVAEIEEGTTGQQLFYAVLKPRYAVTVHDGGADRYDEVPSSFHEWSEYSFLGTAEKEGYTFMGWYADENFTQEIETIPRTTRYGVRVLEDTDVYLKFNKNYALTADLDGGTAEDDIPAYYHKDAYSISLPDVRKTGYTFGGWYGDEARTQRIYAVDTSVERDQTVYVKFTPVTYYVAYLQNGGNGGMVNSVFTYDGAENELKACAFTRTGYAFAGWRWNGKTYAPGITTENFATVEGYTATVSAIWTPITYTVRYENGGGYGAAFEETCTYNTVYVTPGMRFTRTGYRLDGWRVEGKDHIVNLAAKTAANWATEQDAVVKAVAEWVPIEYVLTFVTGDDSEFDGTSYTVKYDAYFTMPRASKRGYNVSAWKIGQREYAPDDTDIYNFATQQGAEVTAAAVWTPITYTLRYRASDLAGKHKEWDVTLTYDEAYTLEVYPPEYCPAGYTVEGWNIQTRVGNNVDIFAYEVTGEPQVYNFTDVQGAVMEATMNIRPISYTVVYEKGALDAEGSMPNDTFTYHGKNNVFAECAYTRAGYEFDGWYMESGQVVYRAGEKYDPIPTEGMVIILHARWKEV